uniref:NACHT domain-containing protein n=1 Tax=Cyprinus carpio TaxID=7962 RepID=A0A8C1LUB6_CYPCA
MSVKQEKDFLSEMSLSEKQSVRTGSDVSSSVSVKSDHSKEEPPELTKSSCVLPPELSEETPSSKGERSSSVSDKSDWSHGLPPDLSEETPSSKRVQDETLDSDFQTHRSQKNFKDNLLWIFKDLESKIIQFLKNELENFKKILQKENMQYFVKDFNKNRCNIKEIALDLTLHFLRDMKQDEAADTLEDELLFIHQLKSNLKNKYQCVFEGIAKQGDSTLLNNIYTDLYITQGGSEQVNTEHEVRQIEVTTRHQESQEIQVECTKMFQAPKQEKHIRTVLTKGVAGIGKSVSVQKFVLDWAEGKENQDISFIFPLPFRELNLKEKGTQSLTNIISQFFPETKKLNLKRRNQFKVLFILDGLDECRLPMNFEGNETLSDVSSPASLDVLLTNLIKGNLLPSALIWITTRPAAASKIPPDCIDRVTEVRGFNDAQKEEYFNKRFTDQNLASEIIYHVKKSKSLFIMCHIPVFCWISATVLHNILEEKRNNDLKNDQADDASKTLQESNTEDIPKTLTQMYTHFLRFQILQSRRKYDGEYTPDVSWDTDAILSLGKLAFHQLERNNLIFYDTDLEACGIDSYKASVYSGMCTQIFKEETGIILGTMYCFVHLSIQEFIAALYAHLFLDNNEKSVFVQDPTEPENKNEAMTDLLKTAVDKALESDSGHLDLFLRFLLGLSLQSNRLLLRGLLTQYDYSDQSKKEVVQYIKQKLEDNLSPERSINLFYCLNELNDQTLVKEIQTHLSKGSLSSSDLSPAQWSALAFVLLTSEEEMEEFELQKFKKSDECLIRLSAVIKTTKRALLNDCNLTDKSCPALATVLGIDTSLKELNMNNNNLQDSGVKHLCTGLKSVNCKLEILRLSDCGITEEGYKALASALRSNPSHLIELDLIGNDPGQSGVKELNDLLLDPDCQLKTVRFLGPAADEACQYVTEIVGKNPLFLRELNLSEHELGDLKQLFPLLQDKHCILSTLILSDCSITEEGYKALASALRSNPSHLIELDLRGNDPGQSGVKQLNDILQHDSCKLKAIRFLKSPAAQEACDYLTEVLGTSPLVLKELDLSEVKLGDLDGGKLSALFMDSHNKLEKIKLNNCRLTEKSCSVLATVLSSKTILKEVNLNNSLLLDSGVKKICEGLKNPVCELKILKLCDCSLTDQSCSALATVLRSNSTLKELDLSNNNLQDSGVKKLQNGLEDTNCTLENLRLSNCGISEEGYKALASALRSNPSHLIELDLTGNDPGQSGVKQLNDLLQDPNCQLKTLRFLSLAADEACQFLTAVMCKNPLLLRELNLSERELGDTQVIQIAALLQDKHCKLSTLILCRCSITEKQCIILTSALKLNPSLLRELELSENEVKNTGVNHLCDILKDSHCKLERLRLSDCSITEEGYKALASALRSNPSHLIELDLRGNDPGQSGVKELSDLLQDDSCKLKIIRFLKSPAAQEACDYLTEVLDKSPLLLTDLDLSEDKIGDLDWEKLSALLIDSHCKLEKITLNNCRLTEKICSVLATVLSSKTILKEMGINNSRLLVSGVKEICKGLKNPVCELKILKLSDCSITEEGYKALASALRSNPSHLIELDLTGNDPGQSGVKQLSDLLQDPNCQLKTLRFLGPAADEACQYVTGIVGKNPLLLKELNLSERKLGDTILNQITALLQDKHCKLNTLTLRKCGLTEESCSALATVLRSNSSLKELDMSNNNLQDSGVKKLQSGLEDTNCTLKKLRLSDCSITEEGYKALTSALRSNPSHLIELDLTGNDPGQTGMKQLNDLLQDPKCQLKTLRFLGPAADEAYQYATEVQGENPLLLRELNLSLHELGDTRVNQIAALLQDKHCKLNALTLWNCSITEKQCFILTSALKSEPSHLREMDLSGNKLKNTGMDHLCDVLKDSHCKLERLRLSCCYMTDEGCSALTSALKSNPSHLRELNLSGNELGDSGVKSLGDLLMNPQFKLEKLHLCECSIKEKQCFILTSALKSNPSHLKELDLSRNELKNTGVNHLCDVLKDSHCKLERLRLRYCDMTDEGCSAVTSALKSNPSHLRELNLCRNELGDSGVKNLSDLLMNPQCKLEKLHLSECGITYKQGLILTSAIKSSPSHLRELDLSENQIKNTGMSQLCDVLKDPHCKLERLSLNFCGITDVSALTQSLTNTKALQFLKELDLTNNMIGDSVKQLIDVLRDSNCKLKLNREQPLCRAATKHTGMQFTSWSKS